MKEIAIKSIEKLRKTLHQHAEIAHQEKETAKIIKQFLEAFHPDELYENVGGYGIIAAFNGKQKGKHLLFRAELDALPIAESNEHDYQSKNEGWGHQCGHDGHMAILGGLAESLADRDFPGKVSLLFQTAEETGEGAQLMIKDFDFEKLSIDYAFALHNLPGFPQGQIILKADTFAAASTGIIIHLKGKPSHASHPQNGINPTLAAMQINQLFFEIPQMHTDFNEPALITPVGTQIGQEAFGTSAAEGYLYATLRTHSNENLEQLKKLLSDRSEAIAQMHQLDVEIKYVENFQAVVNHPKAFQIVAKSAENFDHQVSKEVFPWSEDFGQFSSLFPTCFLGIGAGEDHPQLHNENYNFPDSIIPTAIQLFQTIIKTANHE